MLNKQICILIVEDEKIIAFDLKRILQKLGFKVLGMLSSGEEVLEFIKTVTPDLILMDIMLDGKLDGIETSMIINKEKDIPVIFLTALTDQNTLEKAKLSQPYSYIPKPFEQKTLNSVIRMGIYKHQMDLQLKITTRELEVEKKKSDQLLHNILPAEIVNELKNKGFAAPKLYESTTILFSHFHDFSNITNIYPPAFIVGELNDIFSSFDTIVENYGLEKLKTFGETYMVCGGLPKENEDHAEKTIRAAIDMHKYLAERNRSSELKWELSTGINTGKVVAGVVGTHKYTFDVWGDAVNLASRIENSSEPGKINISETTYKLIKNLFECEYRGKLTVKGRGEIDMYFIKMDFIN